MEAMTPPTPSNQPAPAMGAALVTPTFTVKHADPLLITSGTKEVLRITADGRIVAGEGLSVDTATREAFKILEEEFLDRLAPAPAGDDAVRGLCERLRYVLQDAKDRSDHRTVEDITDAIALLERQPAQAAADWMVKAAEEIWTPPDCSWSWTDALAIAAIIAKHAPALSGSVTDGVASLGKSSGLIGTVAHRIYVAPAVPPVVPASGTPRTDSCLRVTHITLTNGNHLSDETVSADFARQLERELNEARAATDRLRQALEACEQELAKNVTHEAHVDSYTGAALSPLMKQVRSALAEGEA